LVDQAGWHLSTRLVVPPNITIIALPPKCPELNPVDHWHEAIANPTIADAILDRLVHNANAAIAATSCRAAHRVS
jgi:hypothetical protein